MIYFIKLFWKKNSIVLGTNVQRMFYFRLVQFILKWQLNQKRLTRNRRISNRSMNDSFSSNGAFHAYGKTNGKFSIKNVLKFQRKSKADSLIQTDLIYNFMIA